MREWLFTRKRLSRFNAEASSGRHMAELSLPLRQVERVLSWDRWELFRIAAPRSEDRHYVPLALAFALNTRDWDAQALAACARRGLELAAASAPGSARLLRGLGKQGRTLAGLLTEMSARELPLFQFDGLAVLYPEPAPPGPAGGRLLLGRDPEHAGRWRTRIARPVRKWREQPLGTFSFELEAQIVQ